VIEEMVTKGYLAEAVILALLAAVVALFRQVTNVQEKRIEENKASVDALNKSSHTNEQLVNVVTSLKDVILRGGQ
jgi:hypothetical protein